MGIHDFSATFDMLDPACLGYLTSVQLHQFYESLHFSALDVNHVTAAVHFIYGAKSQDLVTKEKFLDVLQEIDRRRQVEEQARWDFQALDQTGSYLLPIPDALLLFRATQGEHFSVNTWRKFLTSRDSATRDVSFDEIRMLLCDIPSDSSEDGELTAEQERLTKLQHEQTAKEHDTYKKAKEQNESAAEKEEHRVAMRRGARRKLATWEAEGLEAFLYDDGVDRGEQLPASATATVKVSDLLDKLDVKYDLLRGKLFWEMIRNHGNNALLSEVDQHDAFQALEAQELRLRREGTLPADASGLSGADVTHSLQLVGLMGGIGSELQDVIIDINEQRGQLQSEGKNETDVEKVLRNNFERKIKGPVRSSDLLVGLAARWSSERDALLACLRGAGSAASKLDQMVVEFCHLERQEALLSLEEEFRAAATSSGLAERVQPHKYNRFDPDQVGQERLASERLRQWKIRKLNLPTESTVVKGGSVTELVAALVKEVTWKQAQEREVCVHLLMGRDAADSKAAARRLSAPQQHHKKTNLRNQRLSWRNSNAPYRTKHKPQHIKMLQEGAGLYYEAVRAAVGGSDSAVCTAVVADLQQTQDAEFEEMLTGLYAKKEKELENLVMVESRSRTEEQLDTLARLLLGVFEVREAERPLLAALDAKYDVLRHVLLLHTVREELGLAWTRLDSDERQRHLVKKKNEELKLRQEGRFEEMVQLLAKIPQDMGSLRMLLGEDREEFSRRQKLLAVKKDQAAMQGRDASLVESDETMPTKQSGSTNMLVDLLQRYYVEQDFVLGWYRSPEFKARGEAHLHLPQVLLQLERRICEREEDFDVAAVTVGLTERVEAATERRHPADRSRQRRLSMAHMKARQLRVEKGLPRQKELDEYARPEKGNLVAWMESFLREQNKKHVEERELLLGVLQDIGLEELVEVARAMPAAERTSRLAELRVKRNKMDMENPAHREENICIIEEAAAIRCVIKQDALMSQKSDISHHDVTVELLMELHEEQDRELAGYISKIHNMTCEDLKKGREYEINARHWESAENVVYVLTRHEGEAEDDELLAALGEKYDSLRDKLLAEMLMKQVGEAEWAALTEEERQRRLIQLKLKEKRLRRAGNLDELTTLLGDNLKNEEALHKLMGDNRAEYDRKLQERLARRQKRIDKGLDPEDDDDLEDGDSIGSATNLLDDLQSRYELEKEALLRQMRGLDAKYLSERDRQAELLRLKREARWAERENNFGNAARLIGLAERQQGELSERLKNDRLRQEQLAQERLNALRKRRGEKLAPLSEEVLREGTKAELQDAVMRRLDEKHVTERELLAHFLSQIDANPDLRLVAQAYSSLDRDDRLDTLRETRRESGTKSTVDNHDILQEACVLKSEKRRNNLLACTDSADVMDEEVAVSLLADLQEEQEKEAETMLNDILDKEESELIALQVSVVEVTKEQRADNVASILFAAEKDNQNELLAALDSKYDALRDKLLIEVLMKKAGEAEWAALSEGERQCRLAEMKLKERQLRRQGKYDEASALLGDALKDHESLQALMGNMREEQEKKIKERLDRREKRRAQGVSEAECDHLEQEEVKAEEEEDKKKRNVLLDLMKNYDAERDALLRALKESQDKAERERLRQAELTRLRREQRRVKTEAKYDAAAIVLGLAAKQQDSIEAERLRQEQLAKERLAARQAARAARGAGQATDEEAADVIIPADSTDLARLQDAILQETELKHKAEVEVLLKVLEEEGESTHREAARALSAKQRTEKREELRQRRVLWRGAPDTGDDQQDQLIREGAGLCLEITAEALLADGKNASSDALLVVLLADLQQSQEHEMRALAVTLSNANAQMLRKVKELQADARHRSLHDHVAITVLGREPLPSADGLATEEREAVGALEKKYDTARDKLLIEALMKEAGEREWAMLSEAERQRRLVRLRLEERKLRRDGRYDEAAALLGQLTKHQAALQEKLGASRSEQAARLEERLKRLAALKAKQDAAGQDTDEQLLNAMVDQEMDAEEQAKKKNVLEGLQHHYDDEKEALLAALRSHDDRETKERQRQLQLARLRREQKLLEKEEKFDSAAILLSMAMQNEEKLEQNFTTERERQQALARERLAARRQLKADGEEDVLNNRLKVAEAKLKAALESSQPAEGVIGLQMALLEEMETKHGSERDALMDLLSDVQADLAIFILPKQLGDEESRKQLEQYRQDRLHWQEESWNVVVRMAEVDGVTETEKANLQKTLDDGQRNQQAVLRPALAIKLNLELGAMRREQPGLGEAEALEEVSVTLLADLQTKQKAEIHAMEKIIPEQGEPTLLKLKDTQCHSWMCGWYENLNSTICTPPSGDAPGDVAEDEVDSGAMAMTVQLDKELAKEKEEYIDKLRRERPGEEIDVDAAMREIEAQHAAKRKALHDALEGQQKAVRARVEAMRRAKNVAEYEGEVAMALIRNAEREHSFVQEKKQKEQVRQQDLMAQRLSARRDARRAAQEADNLTRESSDSFFEAMSDTSSRTNTPSMGLPGGRMRREKSALDVEVSDEQKKVLFSQVVKENADWTKKISADQQRQEDQLQRRLRVRSNKRQDEAEALFSLGMRQKTILEKTKQEERDRQISLMKERVARVRYERTQTMKDAGDRKARRFDELVQDKAAGGLTENEKMELAARRMENTFREQRAGEVLSTTHEQEEGAAGGEAAAPEGAAGGRHTSKEEKMALLKQRRLEKKRQRQELKENAE